MTPFKKNLNRKAFTLLEMVLYVSLCSIILLSLSTFLSFLLESRIRSQSISEVNQQGLQVMGLITQTIRNGRSILTPSIGASASTVSIITSNPLLNPTVFLLSSSTLSIQEAGKPVVALTNSRVQASGLLFQNISSSSSTEKIIRISFILDSRNPQGRNEYAYTKTFIGSATLRQ